MRDFDSAYRRFGPNRDLALRPLMPASTGCGHVATRDNAKEVPEANNEDLGIRRSTLLQLSSMELHEIAHVHRYFVGKPAHRIRHAVVTPPFGQLGHGRDVGST